MLLHLLIMRFLSSSIKTRSTRGFSILEVLITAAIIGIITAVVVVRYSSFNNAVLLKSQAYEVALDIREAQTFALSARGTGGDFREDFGLYFDTNNPGGYLLFRDGNDEAPAQYDDGEQVGVPYFIDSRFEIQKICVNACSTEIDNISITFKRPDFDALFATSDTGFAGSIGDAHIVIENALDPTVMQAVNVSPTGQISIEVGDPSGGS
ncbi:MAG: prepilin-type N-terminal cleavage/methylation domain-containing protein [Bacteroidota bacterium]